MRYTKEQIAAALILFNKTGSAVHVIKVLGYPTVAMLYRWRDKYPEYTDSEPNRRHQNAPPDLRMSTVKRCLINKESVKLISEEIGYSPITINSWCRQYQKEGFAPLMKKTDINSISNASSPEDIEALKAQMLDMQMEIDILKETINVLKKDPGVDLTALKNREKAVIIGALKNKYSLPELCKRLNIPKSSYYYQEKALHAEDKYKELRIVITTLFHDNRDAYGYRKIYLLLKKKNIVVSEKVVRRIMKEEKLSVKQRRRGKYNSYKGEISAPVDNVIARNFHADKPNKKWLTDITEFSIKAGKIYLSPMIDCLDGMPITWTIGTSPNANLVNTMLNNAIATLKPGEKPIVHTDRGCHYRWPDWIRIMEEAGLTRSMSKKGCSPDNSACEGFFGHLKTEMFYGYNWDDYSIEEFIQELDNYLHWYRADRIKSTLGGLSPLDYRRSIGVAV